MKGGWLAIVAVTALILLSILSGALIVPANGQTTPQKRFGFGFIGIGGLITNGFSPQTFFDGMFLTPPYPSTVEFTIQDNSGVGNAFAPAPTGDQLPWLLTEMSLAKNYPNIQMVVHLAFNISSSTVWNVIETQFLPALVSSPGRSSIGAIGFDIEQTNILFSSNCQGNCFVTTWQNALQRLYADVTADGWQFNSYYPQGLTSVPDISQYPVWQSSQPWAPQLSNVGPNVVGINIGGNGNDPWPSPECDYAGNPHWTDQIFPSGYYPNPSYENSGACTPSTAGYTQWPATLDNVLATEAGMAYQYRQWVIFYAGNNAAGFCSPSGCPSDYVYSTGATGVSDYFNWDNVAFRNAIWTDPNYFGNFILSESVTSTSSSTSSSTPTTSSSTTHTSTSTTSDTTSTTSSVTSSTTTSTSMPTTSTTFTSTSLTTTTTLQSTTTTQFTDPFTLNLSSASVYVVSGSSAALSFTAGFEEPPFPSISFSTSSLPPGTSVSFATNPTSYGYEAQATFTSSGTAPGQYPVEITGSAGGYTSTAILGLTILASDSPTYVLSVAATPAAGGTTSPSPGNCSVIQGVTRVVEAIPTSGWLLDQWLVNGVPAGNGSLIQVEMSGNVSVAAVFVPGYVSVASSTTTFLNSGYSNLSIMVDGHTYPLPASFNWPAGSEHNVTATSFVQAGSVMRMTFVGWGGTQFSTSPTLQLDAKGNSSFYPIYQADYLVPFVFSDCDGHSLSAQGVTVQEPGGVPLSIGSGLKAWLTAGTTYRVVAVTWNAASFSSDQLGAVQFVVAGSSPIVLSLPVCDLNVHVSDLFGLPVSGAQVFLQYSNSPPFYAETNSQGTAEFSQVPEGPYTGDVYYMGMSSHISASSSTGNLLLVTMALSYPLLISVIAFGVVLTGAIVVRMQRRHKQKAEIVFFS